MSYSIVIDDNYSKIFNNCYWFWLEFKFQISFWQFFSYNFILNKFLNINFDSMCITSDSQTMIYCDICPTRWTCPSMSFWKRCDCTFGGLRFCIFNIIIKKCNSSHNSHHLQCWTQVESKLKLVIIILFFLKWMNTKSLHLIQI